MTDTPEPTSTADIEDDLHDAVELIRENWQTLLVPNVGPRSGSPSTDTLTALERRILLRQLVDRTLVKWCAVIVRDRHLTARLPSRHDTLGMLDLIDRHAAWFAEHDDGKRAARQLDTHARLVEETAQPRQRDHVYLGPCPFAHPDPEPPAADGWATSPLEALTASLGIVRACRGRVLAPVGGDGFAYCTGCGQLTVVEWWRDVLGVTLPYATLPGLVPILHARLGLRVTEQTLRNWRRVGRITPTLRPEEHEPFGGIGPRLQWDMFDPQAVLEQVADMDRACVLCEQPWTGGGDVCRRCWASTSKSKPKHAPDEEGPNVAGIPVTMRPRILQPAPVVDPHDDDRPQRCHYGDLPLETCGCGHPLAQEGHSRARAALEERRKARSHQEKA